METDEAAFQEVEQPTVFYLPHTPAEIDHNVLVKNWKSTALCNVCIIGNSFSMIADREHTLASRNNKHPAPQPLAILRSVKCGCVIEASIEDDDSCQHAFAFTSVMMFPTFPTPPCSVHWLDLDGFLA